MIVKYLQVTMNKTGQRDLELQHATGHNVTPINIASVNATKGRNVQLSLSSIQCVACMEVISPALGHASLLGLAFL